MKFKKILYWIFGLVLFVSWSELVWGQDGPVETKVIVTDDNFKKTISKGFYVVKFTSEWQKASLDSGILEGIEGYNDCDIFTIKSKDAKSIVKKLRIRNYPSVALFHNGAKKETWKADIDGQVDITEKAIKKAIDDVLAGDVF